MRDLQYGWGDKCLCPRALHPASCDISTLGKAPSPYWEGRREMGIIVVCLLSNSYKAACLPLPLTFFSVLNVNE